MKWIKRLLTRWLLDEETLKKAQPKQVTINIARLVDHITINQPSPLGGEQLRAEIEKALKAVVDAANAR